METLIPRTENMFTNIKGITFENVREIAYKKGQLYSNLGRYIVETKYEPSLFFDEDTSLETGVYIYQSYDNPNVAYRIYKEFADYGFDGYGDDKLIQELVVRQHNVFLSKFPTGVVTLDGKIIGQEIPYFHSSVVLFECTIDSFKDKNPINVYKKILEILKELFDNGITYLDVHSRNFMLDLSSLDEKIDIIDFDSQYIKFDDNSLYSLEKLFSNYSRMINFLNTKFSIVDIVDSFIEVDNFDDAFVQLEEMNKRLCKKYNSGL